MNPYVSAFAVFQDKLTDDTEEFDNESMRQGRDLEDYVAKRFMEHTGKKVRRANAIFHCIIRCRYSITLGCQDSLAGM